jgi:hypothetical protein
MNEQQRAVVQQALEALEKADSRDGYFSYEIEIEALRQLLEQPEPVHYYATKPNGVCGCYEKGFTDGMNEFLLYKTTPPIVATPQAQPTGDKPTPDEGGAA